MRSMATAVGFGGRGRSRAATILVATAAIAAVPASASASGKLSTGDYEGIGAGGTRASFEVAAASVSARVKGSPKTSVISSKVVENFAVDAPIACSNAPSPAIPFDVEVVGGPVRVGENGRFSSGAIKHGAGTVVRGRISASRITLAYRHESQTPNQFSGGNEVCDTGTIHITAVPGRRRPVQDGIWHGQTVTNEPVVFYVTAGGRALEAPPHPPTDGSPQAAFAFGAFTQTCFTGGCTTSSNDICAYESATSLFIASTGAFDNYQWLEGDDPIVSGTLTSGSRATGHFANGPQGCSQTDWSAYAG